MGGAPIGRPRPNLPDVPHRAAQRWPHVAFLWESVNGVDSLNRYAKRGDLGAETGEHFGARIGAELIPNGADYGAVRLPSIRINLHRIALEWAPQLLGGQRVAARKWLPHKEIGSAPCWSRTNDLLIKSQLLCQLS